MFRVKILIIIKENLENNAGKLRRRFWYKESQKEFSNFQTGEIFATILLESGKLILKI